ncbi:hypothetical protein [Mycobacterium paraense]|nr:hypothetical protein [Mycobacterium paraense]
MATTTVDVNTPPKATDTKATGAREAQKELTAAKNLDIKLRSTSRRINTDLTEWFYLVAEAKRTNAHLKIEGGFKTWQAYVTDVLSKDAPLLHAVARAPIADWLREEGLSYPAIAEILGVSAGTAWNDVNRPAPQEPGSPNKDVGESTADITVKRIESATKTLTKKVNDMPVRDKNRVRKETMVMLATVATPVQQLEEVFSMLRGRIEKPEEGKELSTKELDRMHTLVKAFVGDLDKAITARKAGRAAHPAGKRRSSQSRTSRADAA